METNIKELIKYPVKVDMAGYVWDADGNMILMIRGWGRLQYLPDGEKKQDDIGAFIVQAINEKLEKQS